LPYDKVFVKYQAQGRGVNPKTPPCVCPWREPLEWQLTAGFHGTVNSPNTFILSCVPLRSAHFFETHTGIMRKIMTGQ